jgi:hypothetical protein
MFRPSCIAFIGIVQLQASGRLTLISFYGMRYATVTVKGRTATTALFFYNNVCLSVMLDSLSYSITSISFLTDSFGKKAT